MLLKRLIRSLNGIRRDEDARPPKAPPPPGEIDARRVMQEHSVEELNRASEDYFKQHMNNIAFYLKKPLGQVAEASDYLVAFAQMLNGLKPLPGMRLLDFGAGTGWATRYFADFKLEVIACDVSPTALAVARQVFARNPVLESPFKPQFLMFDGRRIALPDASVDRVSCFDAFHHVPNPREVLKELARVLKPGGIAGFSEPGPYHSRTAQSQAEMKNYKLVESDIVLDEIWAWAQEAEFTAIKVALFSNVPHHLDLAQFREVIERGGAPLRNFAETVRESSTDRHIFFLHKGEAGVTDSRDRRGLDCRLEVVLDTPRVDANGWIQGRATAHNTGTARWLPSNAPFGPVKLGVHLKSASGDLLDNDFTRVYLPSGAEVAPGESVEIALRIKAPMKPGAYLLEFDMVSEFVCWFEMNGAKAVAVPVSVG